MVALTKDGKLLVRSGKALNCAPGEYPACCDECAPCSDGIPSQWLVLFNTISYDVYTPPESAACYDGDFDNCCDATCNNYNSGFYFIGSRVYDEFTGGDSLLKCRWTYTGSGECDHTITMTMIQNKDPLESQDVEFELIVRDVDTPVGWVEEMGIFRTTLSGPITNCISSGKTLAYEGFTATEPMDCNFRTTPDCFIVGIA